MFLQLVEVELYEFRVPSFVSNYTRLLVYVLGARKLMKILDFYISKFSDFGMGLYETSELENLKEI